MTSTDLEELHHWISHAVAQLSPDSSAHLFLEKELSEIKQRLDRLRVKAAADAAAQRPLPATGTKAAINQAVALMRAETTGLSTAEMVVLSKLLVLQSQLCSPRFESFK